MSAQSLEYSAFTLTSTIVLAYGYLPQDILRLMETVIQYQRVSVFGFFVHLQVYQQVPEKEIFHPVIGQGQRVNLQREILSEYSNVSTLCVEITLITRSYTQFLSGMSGDNSCHAPQFNVSLAMASISTSFASSW